MTAHAQCGPCTEAGAIRCPTLSGTANDTVRLLVPLTRGIAGARLHFSLRTGQHSVSRRCCRQCGLEGTGSKPTLSVFHQLALSTHRGNSLFHLSIQCYEVVTWTGRVVCR